MVSIKELYYLSEKEWLSYFTLFKACDEEIFHKSLTEGSWSVEKIFRHLLDCLIQINNTALNQEQISSELVIKHVENPNDRIPLEKIEEEYHRLNAIVKKGIEKITDTEEKQTIKLGEREISRGRYLLHMLAHDHNHFGQVIWLLNRQTNWTMKDIKEILQKKKVS